MIAGALHLLAGAVTAQSAHNHHVQLNVTNVERSRAFYERYFGAVPVEYADRTPAVFVERSFLLFEEVAEEPSAALDTAIWHIGWGGVDGPAEFAWMRASGARFQTEIQELGSNHYFYVYGADDELVEVYTGPKHHRFNHVHLLASDVNATTAWFERHLGLEPNRPAPVEPALLGGAPTLINSIRVDNVDLVIFGSPTPESPPFWMPEGVDLRKLAPTRGRVIDHLGFSVRELDPAYQRMKAGGARVLGPPAHRPELDTRSFFVEGPDGLLLQIVERPPLPDALWR